MKQETENMTSVEEQPSEQTGQDTKPLTVEIFREFAEQLKSELVEQQSILATQLKSEIAKQIKREFNIHSRTTKRRIEDLETQVSNLQHYPAIRQGIGGFEVTYNHPGEALLEGESDLREEWSY